MASLHPQPTVPDEQRSKHELHTSLPQRHYRSVWIFRFEARKAADRAATHEQMRRMKEEASFAAEIRRMESDDRRRAVKIANNAATREQLRRSFT